MAKKSRNQFTENSQELTTSQEKITENAIKIFENGRKEVLEKMAKEGKEQIESLEKINQESNEIDNDIAMADNFVNDMDKWDSDIKMSSIQNALNSGIDYPNFNPRANKVHRIKIQSEPIKVITSKGNEFWKLNIQIDGKDFSISLSGSFKFQYKLLLEKKHLTTKQLVGKELLISKNDKGMYSNHQLVN